MIYIAISPFSQSAILDKNFKQNCSEKCGKILHELDENSPSLKQMVQKIKLTVERKNSTCEEGEKGKRKNQQNL
jgi:hypothetical protein